MVSFRTLFSLKKNEDKLCSKSTLYNRDTAPPRITKEYDFMLRKVMITRTITRSLMMGYRSHAMDDLNDLRCNAEVTRSLDHSNNE